MSEDSISPYWQSILDSEKATAAELRERRFTIIDGDGNDMVPELTRKHEANAKAACQQIDFLNKLARRKVGPQANRV